MKKILCFLLVIALLCVGLCGCDAEEDKRQELIDEYLQDGKYQEAYDEAVDSNEKDKIVAENFLAYACYDVAVNVNSDLTLNSGSFGQAEAKTTDAFTSNDPISAIEDYGKLAEYVSFLSGGDVLSDYYYAVFEVTKDSSTLYCLSSVEVEDKAYELMYVWDSLEQTSADGDVEAFYKYVARQIEKNGTAIDKSAVERINEKYLTDSPESVEFEFELD